MKHLDFSPTPVHKLDFYSKKWGMDIWCKRDDLFSKAGGGSKARMLQYILYPFVSEDIKVLVTAGGPCSNFNRATALMCAELGIKVKLISYTDNTSEYKTSLNHFITKLSGVDFVYCNKNEVPETINEVLSIIKQSGIKYKFVYGGGKSIEGLCAYYDGVKELREQFSEKLDAIFVACGTGTTLAGICAGAQAFFPGTKVYGISVARTLEKEKDVLKEDMDILNSYLGTKYDFSNLFFHDEFISGGYSKATIEELRVIRECVAKQGMIIDPTYSGKAFYGMSKIISEFNRDSSVLFWNTGGYMNLLSQRNLFANEDSYVAE